MKHERVIGKAEGRLMGITVEKSCKINDCVMMWTILVNSYETKFIPVINLIITEFDLVSNLVSQQVWSHINLDRITNLLIYRIRSYKKFVYVRNLVWYQIRRHTKCPHIPKIHTNLYTQRNVLAIGIGTLEVSINKGNFRFATLNAKYFKPTLETVGYWGRSSRRELRMFIHF